MERKYYLRGLGLGIAVTAVVMGIMASRDKSMTDQEIITRAKELGMVENTVLSEMNEEEEQAAADIPDKPEPEAGPAEDGSEDGSDSMEEAASDVSGDVDKKPEGSEEPGSAGGRPEESEEPGGADENREESEGPGGAGGNQEEPEESGTTGRPQAGQQASTDNKGSESAEAPQPSNDRENTSSSAVKIITVSPGDGSHTVARKLAEAGIVESADSYDEFLCRNGYDKKLRTGTFSIPADASDEQIARIVTGAE